MKNIELSAKLESLRADYWRAVSYDCVIASTQIAAAIAQTEQQLEQLEEQNGMRI